MKMPTGRSRPPALAAGSRAGVQRASPKAVARAIAAPEVQHQEEPEAEDVEVHSTRDRELAAERGLLWTWRGAC